MSKDGQGGGGGGGQGPPASNRGVPKKESGIRGGLDWLRFSTMTPRSTLASYVEILAPDSAGVLGRPLTPLPHYDMAIELVPGRLDMSNRVGQGGLFTFSGRDLADWREYGRSVRELLAFAVRVSRRITRIDYALDVRLPGADAHDVYAAWLEGRARTRARSGTELSSRTGDVNGYTCYIGSRTSARLVRVYDKAAERGLTGEVWVRIELEAKAPMADSLAAAMVRESIDSAGRAMIREYLDIPGLDWWQSAVAGEAVSELTPGTRNAGSGDRWLAEAVYPYLEKRVRSGDREVVRRLRAIVVRFDQAEGG